MNRKEPTVKEMLARREREVRIVQAIVGGIVGAVVAGGGYSHYSSGPELLVVGVIGGVSGAVGGYYAPPWLSSVEH